MSIERKKSDEGAKKRQKNKIGRKKSDFMQITHRSPEVL
jgi:hypothetical protein